MELNELEKIIRDRLAAVHVELEDESVRHRGHAGSRSGGHLKAIIVSPLFEGRSSLDRHRLVYGALQDEMASSIHALALKTLSPGEWQSK